ncbi:hypothetical protein Lfee_1498, partial [Legionella feeleii]
ASSTAKTLEQAEASNRLLQQQVDELDGANKKLVVKVAALDEQVDVLSKARESLTAALRQETLRAESAVAEVSSTKLALQSEVEKSSRL